MKTQNEAVCLVAAKGAPAVKDICQSLMKEGISAIVIQKEAVVSEPDDVTHHWSGQPGKDLFFNGWKLLF